MSNMINFTHIHTRKCTEMKKHKIFRGFYLLNYIPMLNVSVFRPSSRPMEIEYLKTFLCFLASFNN